MAPNKEGDRNKIGNYKKMLEKYYHLSQNTPPNQGNTTQSPSYTAEEGNSPFGNNDNYFANDVIFL